MPAAIAGVMRSVFSLHKALNASMIFPQQGDDLFGVNDSDELLVMIDYGEGAEIVFVEELGYFAAVGVDGAGNEVALRQAGQWHLGFCEQDSHDGDEPGDSLLFVEEV